jgi:hypothetical protein
MTGRSRFISRRSVIAGAGAAVLGVCSAGAWEWRRVRHPSVRDLSAFLRARLGHIHFEAGTVDAFSAEYVRRFGPAIMAVHRRNTLGGLLSIAAVRRRLPEHREQIILTSERQLISYCLRSTDYFRVPRGSAVRYIAFPDSYESPCTNPFAVFTL